MSPWEMSHVCAEFKMILMSCLYQERKLLVASESSRQFFFGKVQAEMLSSIRAVTFSWILQAYRRPQLGFEGNTLMGTGMNTQEKKITLLTNGRTLVCCPCC